MPQIFYETAVHVRELCSRCDASGESLPQPGDAPTEFPSLVCPDCNGGGYVERWIPISELREQLR